MKGEDHVVAGLDGAQHECRWGDAEILHADLFGARNRNGVVGVELTEGHDLRVPGRSGDSELAFTGDQVTARFARGDAHGHYRKADDRVLVGLQRLIGVVIHTRMFAFQAVDWCGECQVADGGDLAVAADRDIGRAICLDGLHVPVM